MARFPVPKPIPKSKYEIDNFLGIDLTNAPNNISINRSPSCPNMIRDTVGNVRKRDGVTFVKNYSTKGSCTYQITTNAVNNDKVTIFGVQFLAWNTVQPQNTYFLIGSTIAETAANLAETLLGYFAYFNVTVVDDTITVTEKIASGRSPIAAVVSGTITITSGTPITSVSGGINGVHSLTNLPRDIVIPAGRVPGDCDGDGYFTSADFDVLNSNFGLVGETPTIEKLASDVNGDLAVNSYDISELGKLSSDPYYATAETVRDLLGAWGTKYDLGVVTTDWAYYVDISMPGVVAGTTATIMPESGTISEDYLVHIGLLPNVTCGANTIRVYSKLPPISAISAKLYLEGGSSRKIIHMGTVIYSDEATPTALYSTAADTISTSQILDGSIWLLDGKAFLKYDGATVAAVTGYTPTILIARAPTGGGTILEQINLIQDAKRVKFLGTASETVYYLPHTAITAVTLVQKMNVSGVMETVAAEDYTVDLTLGTVTFDTAPGVSPITGEDNIYITYTESITGYADRINKCDISTLYGVNGARDRLFVSGNPDYPNYDWFSAQNDPTYFGDLSYCVIGQDNSAIVNYSIVNDYLVTHKSGAENDSNVSLRKGTLVSGAAVFTIEGSYPAAGALSKYSFADLENEPLYLTAKKNISAITPSDLLGERFSQERSYFISGALYTEPDADLINSFGYTFKGFYFLSVGTNVYVLDGSQFSVEKNKPYSTRQYECYMFQGIGARVMWEENGILYFGDMYGNVKKFDPESSNDEGEAIIAYWDTPELDGGSFANKKTFTYVGVRLAAAPATGVAVVVRTKGIWVNNSSWDELMPYTSEASYFDFAKIDFSNLSFSTDDTPHTLGAKIKVKGVDKAQFRFLNDVLDQPFGLHKILLEYIEGGKYAK